MKTRVTDGVHEYQCDQCGAWSDPAFLFDRRLLCLTCATAQRPADLLSRAAHALNISRALRERLRRRREG